MNSPAEAGMLREYVKWDYELRLPEQLETVFDRGMALALSAPAAPVYLTLPPEVLGARVDGFAYSPQTCRPRWAGAAQHPDIGKRT